MKILLCFCVSALSASALSNENETVLSEVIEDKKYNEILITELKEILNNATIDSYDKVIAFNDTIENLRGDYREKFINILYEAKQSISQLDGRAREAAEAFYNFFENGGFFESRDVIHEHITRTMGNLTDNERYYLQQIASDFGEKFYRGFHSLRPAESLQKNSEESTEPTQQSIPSENEKLEEIHIDVTNNSSMREPVLIEEIHKDNS